MDQPVGRARNIVETAIAAGNLTIFVAGVEAAGSTESLVAEARSRVFAPTDAAFRRLTIDSR